MTIRAFMEDHQLFPMHIAAAANDAEWVESLIELGMSMDTLDKKGEAFLQLAAICGRGSAVLELLNAHKCDGCNQCAKAGFTPLLISAMLQNKDVVDLLIRYGASVSGIDGVAFASFLHWAAFNGWLDVVQLVIERGEDVIAATDVKERTPLLWAANMGCKDVVVFLIQAGADINHEDINKRTALHLSSEAGHLEVVRILLEKEGLDINHQDYIGCTPLHDACNRGKVEVVQKLLAAGADPSIRNNKGETAFNIGIRKQALSPKEIGLFFQNGVYFEDCDYAHILKNSDLKELVLKDVDLCAQSMINEFHYRALPALYCNLGFAKMIPRISNLTLSPREMQDIKNFVELDIRTNMFCNVVKARPIVLKVMCVNSLITTPTPNEN